MTNHSFKVSLHFRGPLNLKQFAVYTPSGNTKRDNAPAEPQHARHAHVHARNAEKRAVGDMVTATIDGQVVSWVNEYSGEPTTAAAAANPASPAVNNFAYQPIPTDAPIATTAQPTPDAGSGYIGYGSGTSSGAWTRQGYYDSASGTSQGLAFLNHFGGTGSGVFDYTYGSSLSYASSDGLSGAASPQVLSDTVLPSVAEVVVFTDKVCSGSDCGFVRPGSVAHHGFDGAEKIFLMEFSMPDTGETSSDIYTPKNEPAIWMLNAQIPRTLQYGPAPCSCWTTGCGEFDIFEVLAPGDHRCKSTIHGNAQGGDSDYFDRPTGAPIKAAVVMTNNAFHIKILDDSTTFGQGLDSSFVDGIVSSSSSNGNGVSLFGLSK